MTTAFNFLTDARLSRGVYTSNNQNNTPVIDGWRPIAVNMIGYTSTPTFGAQLYEKDGQYKIVYRGTEITSGSDWLANLAYQRHVPNDEFNDVVVFAARAMVQVTPQGGSLLQTASRFTTTGHSQGGFEAELISILFGVKGTSLDGMGAAGYAASFRDAFNQIMREQGAGDLVGNHVIDSNSFATRIYTVIGRIGIHAGDTDGSLSWSVARIAASLGLVLSGPGGAAAILAAGLGAHPISYIVGREELRAINPLYRLIGDSGDVFNSPEAVAGNAANQWGAVLVAGPGGAESHPLTSAVNAIAQDFLSRIPTGVSYDIQVSTATRSLLIRTSDGGFLEIAADGQASSLQTQGITTTARSYSAGLILDSTATSQRDDDGNTLLTFTSATVQSASTLDVNNQLVNGNRSEYANGQLQRVTDTRRSEDGSLIATTTNAAGQRVSTAVTQNFGDNSALQTTTYPSGRVEVLATDTTGRPTTRTDTIPGSGTTEVVNRYTYVDGRPVQQSSASIQRFDDGSRIEEVTTFIGGQPTRIRTAYDTDNQPGTPVDITASTTPSFISQLGDALTQSAGLVNLIQAINSGNNTAIASSGLNLVNNLANPIVQLPGGGFSYQFPVLNTAAQVAGGVASFYNLSNAIRNGDAFDKTYASLSTVNYLNITLNRSVNTAGELVFQSGTASASLNSFLNGSGTGGLVGGTPGVLGWLGLINGLKSGDPVSIIQGVGPLIWGQAFTPWGIGIAVLSLLFAKDPEAWGVANVTYGEGFDNLRLKVNASGEEFGPDRVRGQLEDLINSIQTQLDQVNAEIPTNQQLSLIAQHMPNLS
jgi:hypothetical protein